MLINPPASKLSTENAILWGRGKQHEANFRGPLSLESVVFGSAKWAVERSRFTLDSDSWLILSKFMGMDVKVFGISVDSQPTLAHRSKELGAEFPMLSDMMHKTVAEYRVLNPTAGIVNRTTFVVGADGKIAEMLEGAKAADVAGSEEACKRIVKKWFSACYLH